MQRPLASPDAVFLRNLTKRLRDGWFKDYPADLYASVAILLRVSPCTAEDAEQGGDYQSVLSKGGRLEILFMLRADMKGDRWSAQVAFPGGGRAGKETKKQTAVREMQEEVGLDLNDQTSFKALGRLNDRYVVIRAGKYNTDHQYMSLSTFVFIQTRAKTPPLHLNPAEVRAVRWVPISFFLDPALVIRPFAVPVERLGYFLPYGKALPPLLASVGIASISYRSLHLPYSGAAGDEDIAFTLWGLTLGMVLDMFQLADFALPLHSATMSDSHLMNALLFATSVKYLHLAALGLGLAGSGYLIHRMRAKL